jgi:hypothetical protein
MEGKPAFVTWFNKNCPINSDRKTLGCDVKLPEVIFYNIQRRKICRHQKKNWNCMREILFLLIHLKKCI